MTIVEPDGQSALPPAGAVLGVDVGFSPMSIRRFRALPDECEATTLAVAGPGRLEAVAFDGLLQAGFDVVGRYCLAERVLTHRLGLRISEPGQAHAPVGKALNAAANGCAGVVLRGYDIAGATHVARIDRVFT